jgi:hypothetical protein
MSNEINALELTDEQLDMVAGGYLSNVNNVTKSLTLDFNGETTNSFSASNSSSTSTGYGRHNKAGSINNVGAGTNQQGGSVFSGITAVIV